MNARNELKTHARRSQLLGLIERREVTSRRGKAAILKACECLREATLANRRLRLQVNTISGQRKNSVSREGHAPTPYSLRVQS